MLVVLFTLLVAGVFAAPPVSAVYLTDNLAVVSSSPAVTAMEQVLLAWARNTCLPASL